MRRLGCLVGLVLAACPGPKKRVQTPVARPTSTSVPAVATPPVDEEIGLLSVRLASLSPQAACVYGGWTCQSGEQMPLLRCTTDGGKHFQEPSVTHDRCQLVKDAQVSRDGSAVWLSCDGESASYFLHSDDGAQTFSISRPFEAAGELMAWTFLTNKSGVVVLAAEGPDAEAKNLAYVERSTSDGGQTWRTVLEITTDFAANFSPEQEVGKRPPPPEGSSFTLKNRAGPDGGPAYRLEDNSGKALLDLAWKDRPHACSKADSLPTEDLFPEIVPGQVLPK